MGLPTATGAMDLAKFAATGTLGITDTNEAYAANLISTVGVSLLRYYRLNETSGTVAYDSSANAGHGTYGGSPQLGQPGKTVGEKSVYFGANSYANIYSSAFNTAFIATADEMTVGFWFKAPDANWNVTNALNQYFYNLQVDGNNERSMYAANTGAHGIMAINVSGGVDKKTTAWGNYDHVGYYCGGSYLDWQHIVFTTSKSANASWFFLNGSCIYNAPITGVGTWAGNLASIYAIIGNSNTGTHPYAANCYMSDFFIASRALTFTEVAQLSIPRGTSLKKIFMIGDSTTANLLSWPLYFINREYSTRQVRWAKIPKMHATAGIRTDQSAATLAADMAAYTEIPDYVVINLGKNDYDIGPGDPGPTWKTNMLFHIDSCHAAYPDAPIYIWKVWESDAIHAGRVTACITAMNGYIDEILADPAYSFCHLGVNEATIVPNGDDGATYTYDGVHNNDAGGRLLAEAFQDVLEGKRSFT